MTTSKRVSSCGNCRLPSLGFQHEIAMQTRSKCSSIVKLTRSPIQNFRSGQKQSFPNSISKVVFDTVIHALIQYIPTLALDHPKRYTQQLEGYMCPKPFQINLEAKYSITKYLNCRNIAFTQRALSHENSIDLEPFQTAVGPHCAGSAFCLHSRFGNEHNTRHPSAQLGVSAGGKWGLVSICFQLRDISLWHFPNKYFLTRAAYQNAWMNRFLSTTDIWETWSFADAKPQLMPDVLNGKLLSAMHLLHACLDLPTLLSLAFPHSSINDLQAASCVFLNGTVPFLANCLFPLKPLARMAWFLETVLLPRQLLLASLMHLSRKHLTSDEEYAVGSCLVKRQLQNGAAPPPSLTESMRYGQCSALEYCL